MNSSELNAFIHNYVRNDLTHGALVLAGAPGNGKSHYVRYALAPYLKNCDPSITCIMVSLAGMKDLQEVSKSLFLENRVRKVRQKSETSALGTILAKTVIRSLAKHYHVELDTEKEDYDNLFSSVDLANRLVVFDDVCRTKIDPEELHNYISSLTRQDGVKVLLIMDDKEDAPETASLRTAMETASISILRYEPDIPYIIENVLTEYKLSLTGALAEEEEIRDIEQCFEERGTFSIDALFFACQKTADLYRRMHAGTGRYDQEFLKTIFLGILHYSLRITERPDLAWEDEDLLSFRLGSDRYPLCKFCYTYITRKIFESTLVGKTQALFLEFRRFDSQTGAADPDLYILYTWFCQKETDVLGAVERITERLQDPDAFPLREYGRIAACLLQVQRLLHCDIETAEERMIANLTGKGIQVNSDFITRMLVTDEDDPEMAAACAALRKRMLDALKKVDTELIGFTYRPSGIRSFSAFVREEPDKIMEFGAFARALDNRKIRAMLQQCSAMEIFEFRRAYISVYRRPNSRAFLSQDADALAELAALIRELEASGDYDRIQRINLREFLRDLEDISLD